MPPSASQKTSQSIPFECIALLLQGGGALGAYQAGVYQGLHEADICPNWVAGISIGAINCAIIAGNEKEKRLENLRKFWELITTVPVWGAPVDTAFGFWNDAMRGLMNQMSAGSALVGGVPNFFAPRQIMPWFNKPGSLDATSYYDTSKLKTTLEKLIDFDRLNNGDVRFSAGAVNVKSGNLICFDTLTHHIGAEHIMASAALPPGFPAIEIEGEYYWDGGLVSNTPLQWVIETRPRQDTLAFQVDLWSADGPFPKDMAEVITRQKEIQFSSRTRANTDRFKNLQKYHYAVAKLMEDLPDDMKKSEEAKWLFSIADRKVYNLAHLIYHTRSYEKESRDYEFSRPSMEDHWQAGLEDTRKTLQHPQVLKRPANPEGMQIFDFSRERRKADDATKDAEQ